MAGFALRKHMDFEWSGAQYRIERLQPNGEILLERLEDGHLQIVSREALLQAFSSGEVRANPNPVSVKSPIPFSRPLDELPEAVRGEVMRRHAYIQALLDDGVQNFNADNLAPIVAGVALRINDPKPPSRAMLWRWYRRYVTHHDNRALIPHIDQRGSHRLKHGARVLQLAEQAIEEAYRSELRGWLARLRATSTDWITPIEAAKRLGLKEQVVYELVSKQLLAANLVPRQGRVFKRISLRSLEQFQAEYVSLATLAKVAGTSASLLLRQIEAQPVTGPRVDGGRQYFYRRADLSPAIADGWST